MSRYDIAIIGTGPAGLEAAITAKVRNKNVLLLGAGQSSEKVWKAHTVQNYLGLPEAAGKDLQKAFLGHLDEMGLRITEDRIIAVYNMGEYFGLQGREDVYEAETVILATGVVASKPFPGEEEFLGRGVSYCATCDGFLYKGKTIAVHLGAEKYEHEAVYLAEIADKVYLSAGYKDCKVDLPNVEKLATPIGKINGEMKVSGIETVKGEARDVDGVFILRNAVAPSMLINGLELEGPHIVVDRKMQTNIAGCYAAGDCTGRPYQITKAVGEGNIAAHSILEYLAELDKN